MAIFPKGPLLTAFHEHPMLAAEFMALLAKRFNMLRIRLELRNLQSARERVLQYLHMTASPGKATVVIDRPLKSIADDLGLTHESFYRTLAQLATEGIITRKKGSIAFRIHGSHDPDHTSSARTGVSSNGELEAQN